MPLQIISSVTYLLVMMPKKPYLLFVFVGKTQNRKVLCSGEITKDGVNRNLDILMSSSGIQIIPAI